MMGHGPVQPGWDNPNCGRHTARPNDTLDGCRGLRAPTTGSPSGRGKGMGPAPALYGVARLKSTVVVELQEQQPSGSGASHHSDRGVGQQLRAAVQ
jgi:hypothetical protein